MLQNSKTSKLFLTKCRLFPYQREILCAPEFVIYPKVKYTKNFVISVIDDHFGVNLIDQRGVEDVPEQYNVLRQLSVIRERSGNGNGNGANGNNGNRHNIDDVIAIDQDDVKLVNDENAENQIDDIDLWFIINYEDVWKYVDDKIARSPNGVFDSGMKSSFFRIKILY